MKCNKQFSSQIKIPETVLIKKRGSTLLFSGLLGFSELSLTKIDPTGLGSISISLDGKTLNIFSQSKSFFYTVRSLCKNRIRGVTVGFHIYLRIIGVGYRASLLTKKIQKSNASLSIDNQYKKESKEMGLCLDRDTISDGVKEGHMIKKLKSDNKSVPSNSVPRNPVYPLPCSDIIPSELILQFKLGKSHLLLFTVCNTVKPLLLNTVLLCLFGIDKNQVSQIGNKIRSLRPPDRYKGKGIRFTTERVKLSQGKRK